MKKINTNFSNRDRIVCVTLQGIHQFYYQPVRSNKRYWLFNMDFSGSTYAYFRKYGCRICEKEFSLSLKEVYKFNDYHNPKLTRLMNRIPGQVQYVLKNEVPSADEMAALIYTRTENKCESHDLYGHGIAA